MKNKTEIELQAWADGYNAGFGKKKYRVIYCKRANEFVLQIKDGTKWLCLHDNK